MKANVDSTAADDALRNSAAGLVNHFGSVHSRYQLIFCANLHFAGIVDGQIFKWGFSWHF